MGNDRTQQGGVHLFFGRHTTANCPFHVISSVSVTYLNRPRAALPKGTQPAGKPPFTLTLTLTLAMCRFLSLSKGYVSYVLCGSKPSLPQIPRAGTSLGKNFWIAFSNFLASISEPSETRDSIDFRRILANDSLCLALLT